MTSPVDPRNTPNRDAKSGCAGGGPPLPCLLAGGWAGRRCSAQHLGEPGARFSPSGLLGGKWLPRCVSSGRSAIGCGHPRVESGEAGHPTRSAGNRRRRLRSSGPRRPTPADSGLGSTWRSRPTGRRVSSGRCRLAAGRTGCGAPASIRSPSAVRLPHQSRLIAHRSSHGVRLAALISLGSFGSP